MSDERSLKKEGEELAKAASESGMGSKQLQNIFRLTKTKPMPYVEAFIQRQIGRGIRGYSAFTKILELLKKYEDNKATFERVLMYAVMLVEYIEIEPTMELRSVAEPIVEKIVERYGSEYEGLKINLEESSVEFRVKTRRFHGNPKALAMDIEKALKDKGEFFKKNLRVWIE